MSRHSREAIETRNSIGGSIAAAITTGAAIFMLFLIVNAAINPPSCTHINLGPFSVCL